MSTLPDASPDTTPTTMRTPPAKVKPLTLIVRRDVVRDQCDALFPILPLLFFSSKDRGQHNPLQRIIHKPGLPHASAERITE